jgi:hypothetical protein
MKRIIYLTLITGLIFVTSCAKRIEDVNTDYYGYWESIDVNGFKEFDINQGISSYISYEGIKTVSSTGTARVRKNESKLKIGFKGFKVNTPPYQDSNGTFFMVIEGDTYEKY